MNKYVIDFENENADENIINEKTHIWLYDFCKIDEKYEHIYGYNIDDFFKTLERLAPCDCYSHNLKYDGIFILDYILKHGYKYIELNSKKEKLKPYQFNTLIASTGVFYKISICFPTQNKKKLKIVNFMDSCKKINGSVESIAKDFKLPILKGEIDYNKKRGVDYIATPEEVSYIKNDTEIIARVLTLEFKMGLDKLTTASDTMALYKDKIGNFFKLLFPILPIEVDDYIRQSYRGGMVLVSDKIKGKIINSPVYVYDVNSMYPYNMLKTLPYGTPVFFKGQYKFDKIYNLYIQKIEVCCKLKPNKVPCILINNVRQGKLSYLTDTENELIELTLTSIDLSLLIDNYEIYEIQYIDGYKFCSSENLFKKFIVPLYDKKCNAIGSERQLYKLLLNGLYGKFATNPRRQKKIPYLKNDIVAFRNSEVEIDKPIYTAVSAFITAHSRKYLVDNINAHFDDFVYCDTDSIHLLNKVGGNDSMRIDKTRLGYFDLEKIYVKSKYLAQKTYLCVKDNGEIDCKVAGCPKNVKLQFDFNNFNFGTELDGKLVPKKVNGGSVLKSTTFTLKNR